MKKIIVMCTLLIAFMYTALAQETTIKLSKPTLDGKVSIEKVLNERRSVRAYKDTPLTEKNVSQLLWAGQGITDESSKKRTAPSARAKYPLELYLVVFNVQGIEKGVYKYVPDGHTIVKVFADDKNDAIVKACNSQASISKCPAAFIIAGNYLKMSEKIDDVTIRFTQTEVGHVSQNISLQAVALDLGTVVIGGFQQDLLSEVLEFPDNTKPIYVMPVGNK
jgi:SagB-type dehydrogenase family enzyme